MKTHQNIKKQLGALTAVVAVLLAALAPHSVQATQVTYTQQLAGYPTAFFDGGGDFNQGTTQLGMWAHSGNKNAVAWRNFMTADGGAGSARSLQVGDVFQLSVSATRAFGQIGFSLNAGGTQGSLYANNINGSRLYFNTDNYGAWYVNRSGGATVFGSGYNPIQGTFKNYNFNVRITSQTTADAVLTVDGTAYNAYNLTMNGSSGANINAFSVYLSDDWDGGANQNIYWQQPAGVTNSGVVQLGYFLASGTFTPGLITDGLDAASTSTVSSNSVLIGGNSGTAVILSQANTFTGPVTVNAGATAQLQNNAGFGSVTGGTVTVASGGTVQLTNGVTVGATKALTLNGAGVSANGALENITGNNTWSGKITLGSSATVASDAGTLTLSGSTLETGGNTLTSIGAGNTTITSVITNSSGSGSLIVNSTGTLTLVATNAYSGGTTINAGTLSIASDVNLGAAAGGLTINGGLSSVLSISNSLALNASRTITIGASGGKLDAGTNTLTISGTLTNTSGNNHLFILANGNTTIAGNATGAGDIVKQGSGTLTLNGSGNTFGTTLANIYIDNGVVQGSSSTAFGQIASGGGAITMGADAVGNNGPTTLLLTGGGASVTNAINVRYYSGFNASKTVGGNNVSGTVAFYGNLTINDTVNLTSVSGGTVSFNGIIQPGVATGGQSLNGAPGISIIGGGTVSLLGTNTYSGITRINAGALALSGNGSIASSPLINVANGAVFDVSGLSSTFVLGAGQTLSNNASSTGTVKGNLNTGSGTTSVSFTSGNPAFIVTNGTLTLSSSTVFKINNTGTALGAGNYLIISNVTSGTAGLVAGTAPTVSLSGNTVANTTAGLSINSSGLNLVIKTNQTIAFGSGTSLTKTYGDASFADTATASSGLTVTYSSDNAGVATVDGSGNVTIVGAGTCHVLANQSGNGTYNAASQVSQTLTVNQAASSWGYTGSSFNYIAASQGPAISFSGSTGARTTNFVGVAPTSYGPSANAPVNAGSYALTNTVLADVNYYGATNGLAFIIGQTNLTITARTSTKIYDGTTSATNTPAITAGSLQGSDAAALTEAYANSAVGTGKTLIPSIAITNAGVNVLANYNVTKVNDTTGVINPAQATTTVLLTSNVGVTNHYGQPLIFSAFVQTNSVIAANASSNVVFSLGSTPVWTNAVVSGVAYYTNDDLTAGVTNFTAQYLGDNNYLGSSLTVTQTVLQTAPTLTLTAGAITYGQTLGSSTLSGSVATNSYDLDADGDEAVAGSFAFANTGIAPNAGTTNVWVVFTPVDTTNYTTASNTVTVTVTKANSSVSVTGTTSFTYNGVGQGPATANVTGSSGSLSFSYSGAGYGPGANAPTNAASYTVTATVAADNNYNGVSSSATAFTISAKAASVTANAKTKTYGDANPALTATVAGTVNGDLLSYTLATDAAQFSSVGISNITVTLGSNPNYNVSATNSTLTIGAKAASVTADAKTKTYGDANPTLTATVAGTVNGDLLSYTLATDAAQFSSVGISNITVMLGSNPNYNVSATNSTLTINPASTFVGASSTLNPSGYKDSVAYIATLPADATGSVVFSSTNGAFSTNTVSGISTTSLSISNLQRGTNLITVAYLGDGNYFGSTNTLDQIVTNHPPVATNLTVYRTAGQNLHVNLTNLAAQWNDADGDVINLTGMAAQSANNAINLKALGWTNGVSITTNAANFGPAFIGYTNGLSSPDLFTYTISDNYGGTNTGTVYVIVDTSALFTGQSTGIAYNNTAPTLHFYGVPGFTYCVQRSPDLTPNSWVDISTNAATTLQPVITITDTNNPSAFYRLRWQP